MLFRLLVLLHHCILCTQITGKKKMLQVKIASNHFKSIQKPQSFTAMGIRHGLRGTFSKKKMAELSLNSSRLVYIYIDFVVTLLWKWGTEA